MTLFIQCIALNDKTIWLQGEKNNPTNPVLSGGCFCITPVCCIFISFNFIMVLHRPIIGGTGASQPGERGNKQTGASTGCELHFGGRIWTGRDGHSWWVDFMSKQICKCQDFYHGEIQYLSELCMCNTRDGDEGDGASLVLI